MALTGNWLDRSVGAVAGALGQSTGYGNQGYNFTKGYGSSVPKTIGSQGVSGFGTYAYRSPTSYASALGNPVMRWQSQLAQNAQENLAKIPGQTGSQAGSIGGNYAGVEQWGSQINQAAAQYGIPANLIKAVMQLESGGDPNAAGAPGVWGPMQINANAWGYGPWSTDPTANIMKGAEILSSYYKTYGNWYDALRHYHGIGWDGYTSDTSYADIVMGNYTNLNTYSAGGTAGLGYNPGSSNAITTMFGNATVPDWGEFNTPSSNGMYGYGTAYGMNGVNHTGVDVPMPVGTPIRAPMGGTVMCAGTGNGPGSDGGGCAAFNDTFGQGAGRIELLLDNGAVLIFGHSSTSNVAPGQRVNAGAIIGSSGGQVSEHIHLEARVRDASTSSGWRIVDPRTVVGGGSFSTGGYAAPTQTMPSGGNWWMNGGAPETWINGALGGW